MAGPDRSLLRLVTAGSVDDGKSTLIGRLLVETRSVFEDQLEAVRRTSARKGLDQADLALLLDGLAAEREQGITIDVAYRYFETPVRKFIIADCPGHVQYTRNMATGAAGADCAVILVDARQGILEQTRRHGFIASLLRIPHLVLAVNKMDLVGYRREVFDRVVEDFVRFAQRLDLPDLAGIPVSALRGDNITARSAAMPWYQGPALLHHLERLHVPPERNLVDFRFPVQMALRPEGSFRGYAGRIASGTIRPGEEVTALPSGRITRVGRIVTYDGDREEAFAPQSVVLTLEDAIDLGRGDMLVRSRNRPAVTCALGAVLCWFDEQPLQPGAPYLLKHTTRTVRARVSQVVYRFDPGTLHRDPAATLGLNDIGRVEVRTAQPLFLDPYADNPATGGFILIDPVSNRTVAAGMVRRTAATGPSGTADPAGLQALRRLRNGHRPAVLWFTGLPGAGKSTLAEALEARLLNIGCSAVRLDGDQLRATLCRDLGFTDRDRDENIRRAGEVARILHDAGHLVLCAFISPFQAQRDQVRRLLPPGGFLEIHVRCRPETCRRRDPKGLYRRAAQGQIEGFTGISAPYEAPAAPDLVLDTETADPGTLVAAVLERLRADGILEPEPPRRAAPLDPP